MARPNKQQNIEPWLKGLLGAGRRRAQDVIAAAEAAGIKERTLRRVKAALEMVSEQEGEVWYWRDPAVAEPKAASEDKLDVIDHKLDEAIRLAKPAVPVQNAEQPDGLITSKKSKPYDPQDPKNKAIAEQYARVQERFNAVQGVVTSADPFTLLESADLDEAKEMLLLVRNYQSGFEAEKPNEDDLAEMGKWDEFVDRAKERIKHLEKHERDRKNDLDAVLAT